MRHSESLELGRAQVVYLLWSKLSTILHESEDLDRPLYDDVEEVVDSLYDWCKRYADAHPDQRDEIVEGVKSLVRES